MPLPHSYAECIKACQRCFETCLATADGYCLATGGEHVAPAHLRLMHDCADICRLSVTFMLRHSTFHPRTCALCAEVCTACGDHCASFSDDTMQACAKACQQCADACRAMVATHAGLAPKAASAQG